jgi:hypothetical protein
MTVLYPYGGYRYPRDQGGGYTNKGLGRCNIEEVGVHGGRGGGESDVLPTDKQCCGSGFIESGSGSSISSESGYGSRVLMINNCKKNTADISFSPLLIKNCKKVSSTSKDEIYQLFYIFLGYLPK